MTHCEHCGCDLKERKYSVLRYTEGEREGQKIAVCMPCLRELYGKVPPSAG